VSQFLTRKGTSAMDHLQYTPDFAPSDFQNSEYAERRAILGSEGCSSVRRILTDIPVQDLKT
jgi:hypothetical protein